MLGVLADDHDFAFSLNDFALFANLLYGWFNLHFITPTLSFLLCPPGNASLGQVIDRNLDSHAVTGQYSDIVHTELPGNMGSYNMPVRKLDFEGSVGQRLDHFPFKLDYIILRQNNPSSAMFCDLFAFSTYHSLSTSVVMTTPSDVRATVFS